MPAPARLAANRTVTAAAASIAAAPPSHWGTSPVPRYLSEGVLLLLAAFLPRADRGCFQAEQLASLAMAESRGEWLRSLLDQLIDLPATLWVYWRG